MRPKLRIFLAALLILFPCAAQADDDLGRADGVTSEVTELIADMDDSRFTTRQLASQKLFDLGEAAIPALRDAALKGSREVSTRSMSLLRRHFQGGNESAKKAAHAALEAIAASDKPVAAKANEIIKPTPPPAAPGFPALPIQIQGGAIQIQVQGIGQRIQMNNNNGVKQITASDNGRTIKIVDDPNNGITVDVTETKDGKEVTSNFAAKNADELKKNHPEAYQLFQKYSRNMPVIQLRGLPQNIQRQFQVPIGRQLESRRAVANKIAKAVKELEETTAKIKKLTESAENAEELRKAIEQLEKTRDQLKSARTALGG